MTNNNIIIDNEEYYLDIDAIMKWCLTSSTNPFKESEINEGYDTDDEGDLKIATKVVRELKTANVQDDTVRYDFVKMLLTPFFGEIIDVEDIKNNLSYRVIFNTLIEKKFLVKISE